MEKNKDVLLVLINNTTEHLYYYANQNIYLNENKIILIICVTIDYK